MTLSPALITYMYHVTWLKILFCATNFCSSSPSSQNRCEWKIWQYWEKMWELRMSYSWMALLSCHTTQSLIRWQSRILSCESDWIFDRSTPQSFLLQHCSSLHYTTLHFEVRTSNWRQLLYPSLYRTAWFACTWPLSCSPSLFQRWIHLHQLLEVGHFFS